MLALLIFSMLTLESNVRLAKMSGTIYIMPDGSIDPPSAPIEIDSDVYTFTADIYDSIVVEKDGIAIEGNGYLLQGAGSGTGLDLSGRGNVTIRDIQVREFYYGMYLYNSSNNTVRKNNITNNNYGITLVSSSDNNTVSENVFVNDGLRVIYSYRNVVENNFVNGKPLTYLEGVSDITVNWDTGQVILVDCDRVIVENLILSYTSAGIQLGNTNSTKISNNSVTNSRSGIELWSSSNNSIHGNNVTANIIGGIGLDSHSTNNTISENIVTNNPIGMEFWGSGNNTISGNNITASIYSGIEMYQSLNTVVSRNNVANNAYGIVLSGSLNNALRENNIADNDNGVLLYNSPNNKIAHNTFRNNINQTGTQNSSSVWDDGYPSGGNYWSDRINGGDVHSGPFQNETGGDGIVDTPYVIDDNNEDRYPLTKPYGAPYDIGITNVTPSKTAVGEGYVANVTVKVLNYGINTESFDLTIYANTTAIQTITDLVLATRNSVTINVAWNTTGFVKGNYTVNAYVTSAPDETDIADNHLNGSIVLIGVPSDITGTLQGVPDGQCDMRDINYISSRFGTTPASSNWDPNTDITGPTPRLPDNKVNMRDIGEACSNFGGTVP